MTTLGAPGLVSAMSAPSPPAQVAVTTTFPARRAFTQRGTAVSSDSGVGPRGLISYPPIGAAKPLNELPLAPATGWKVLEAMSSCADVDPVAMRRWPGA